MGAWRRFARDFVVGATAILGSRHHLCPRSVRYRPSRPVRQGRGARRAPLACAGRARRAQPRLQCRDQQLAYPASLARAWTPSPGCRSSSSRSWRQGLSSSSRSSTGSCATTRARGRCDRRRAVLVPARPLARLRTRRRSRSGSIVAACPNTFAAFCVSTCSKNSAQDRYLLSKRPASAAGYWDRPSLQPAAVIGPARGARGRVRLHQEPDRFPAAWRGHEGRRRRPLPSATAAVVLSPPTYRSLTATDARLGRRLGQPGLQGRARNGARRTADASPRPAATDQAARPRPVLRPDPLPAGTRGGSRTRNSADAHPAESATDPHCGRQPVRRPKADDCTVAYGPPARAGRRSRFRTPVLPTTASAAAYADVRASWICWRRRCFLHTLAAASGVFPALSGSVSGGGELRRPSKCVAPPPPFSSARAAGQCPRRWSGAGLPPAARAQGPMRTRSSQLSPARATPRGEISAPRAGDGGTEFETSRPASSELRQLRRSTITSTRTSRRLRVCARFRARERCAQPGS